MGTRFEGSSWGLSWRECRQKEREDRRHDQLEVMSGTGEGSYQTQRTVSGATGRRRKEERDEEVERLRRLVRGLELVVRGKRQGGERNDRQQEDGIGGNRYEEGSNQSGHRLQQSRSHSRESYWYRDRSHSRVFRRNRNRSPSWKTGQHRGRSHSQENQVRDSLSQKRDDPGMLPWTP